MMIANGGNSQSNSGKADRNLISLLHLYHLIKNNQMSVKIELNFLMGDLKSDSTKITGNVEKLLTLAQKTG